MPVRLTSEKFLRAERKNRLETHRLNITYKSYDRETVRLNYEVDREKKTITKQFRNVVKTSGASDVGLPPKNEKDKAHEKSPSYIQGLKLSTKRLQEWRECEKQLNKFIMNHEAEMKKKNRKMVFKAMDDPYKSVSPKKVEIYDDDEVFETKSDGAESKISPIDLLKEDPEDENEVFDVEKWQKDIIESYKNIVSCNECSTKECDKENRTKLRSKSSPSIGFSVDDGVPKRVRPHTAHARSSSRPGSGKPRSRPSSAHVNLENETSKFLITKDSVFMKSGHKFEKFLDCRPPDKPLMVNNYLDSLVPTSNAHKEPSIASVSSLCPVAEGDEDEAAGESETNGQEENAAEETSEHKFRNVANKVYQARKKSKMLRKRNASGTSYTSQNTRVSRNSSSDVTSVYESTRRMRRDSGSSVFSRSVSMTGSHISSRRPSESLGIPADIENITRGQDKLASEITADKPLAANKLVAVSKVVKAAMTFSRMARKRALNKMQEENSSDPHEIIRQERLRKLQSRQNVLNTISNSWTYDSNAIIEEVH